MKRLIGFFGVGCLVGIIGCSEKAPELVKKFSLAEVKEILQFQEAAVMQSNLIVSQGHRYWQDEQGFYRDSIVADSSELQIGSSADSLPELSFQSLQKKLEQKKIRLPLKDSVLVARFVSYHAFWDTLKIHKVYQIRRWGPTQDAVLLALKGGVYLGDCLEARSPYRTEIEKVHTWEKGWCEYRNKES